MLIKLIKQLSFLFFCFVLTLPIVGLIFILKIVYPFIIDMPQVFVLFRVLMAFVAFVCVGLIFWGITKTGKKR